MDVIIKPRNLNGVITAVASKSCAHRMLICAALGDKPTIIECEEVSEDIKATVRCLNSIGANITRVYEFFFVYPIKEPVKNCVLDCGESGSTLRFLLPVVAALGCGGEFKMSGRLPNRPIDVLCDELKCHGCNVSKVGEDVIKIEGKCQGGRFTLTGEISSQYISGVLLALPIIEGCGSVCVTGKFESQSYVKLTMSIMEQFGVKSLFKDNVINLETFNKYQSKPSYRVEGDWSNAAFWIAASMISKEKLGITGIQEKSVQGDRRIIDIIELLGGTYRLKDNVYTFKYSDSIDAVIDASDVPDLVPILSVIATAGKSNVRIVNAGRLRLKESDRIISVVNMINSLGGKAVETEDGIIINGNGTLKGGTVDSCNDHRIAMSAAIAAVICSTRVKITGAESVNKSYPDFWTDYRKLNGEVSVL